MRYTDENVPVECFECPTTDWEKDIGCAYGVKGMEQHILDNHPNYTPKEAKDFARIWTEGAYEKIEEWEANDAKEYRKDFDK